ncbi:hypothetical protein [Streptomyces sp. NPDC058451]
MDHRSSSGYLGTAGGLVDIEWPAPMPGAGTPRARQPCTRLPGPRGWAGC